MNRRLIKNQSYLVVLMLLLLTPASQAMTKDSIDIQNVEQSLSRASTTEDRLEVLLSAGENLRETAPHNSMEYSREALDLARSTNNLRAEIRALILLGELYNFLGSFDMALEQHLNAVTLAEESENYLLLAFAYNSIGGVYYNQEDYTRAFPYFSRALNLRKEHGSDSLIAGSLNNVGEIYRIQGQPERALDYYEEALEINEKLGHVKWVIINLNNIGLSHMKIGDLGTAREYFDRSLKLSKDFRDEISLIIAHMSMGQLYAEYKNLELAIQHLEIAYKKAHEINSPRDIRDASGLLSQLYEKNGEYSKALEFQKVSDRIKDSMLNEDRLKRQMLVREHFETDKKEQEIQSLRNKQAVNEVVVEQQKRENYVLIGSGILLTLLLVFAITQNRQKKKNNRLLEETLAQKEVLLKEIHHRVKNNLQLVSSLLSLQADKINDPNALEAVRDSHSRVRSMSILHQELYMRTTSASIDLRDYMEKLLDSARDSFGTSGDNVRWEVNTEALNIDVDQAIPIGLIVNELATNAFKYAFDEGESGLVSVSIQSISDDEFQLVFADNGKGIPEDFDLANTDSLGLEIVEALTGQLEGSFDYFVDNGTRFVFTFPLKA